MLDCAEALEHLKKEIKKKKRERERERQRKLCCRQKKKRERERERVKGEDKTQYVDSSKPYKYIPPKRGLG
jgi:hypothetical protein